MRRRGKIRSLYVYVKLSGLPGRVLFSDKEASIFADVLNVAKRDSSIWCSQVCRISRT